MKKKSLITLCIIGIVVVIFIIFSNKSLDEGQFANTFEVSAVYLNDDHLVKISYHDKTNKTNTVTLEVIGLSPSFQKIYHTSNFVEDVSITDPPQYGWSTLPVTFLIEHEQLGEIQLKTEITPIGEPPSKIIYSKP